MIGVVGSRADPVMVHFAARCIQRDEPFAVIDLLDVSQRGEWSLTLPPAPTDVVSGAEVVRLADLTGIYIRPIYLGRTPPELVRWRGLMDGLNAWLEETDLLVVNRPGHHQLNSYKPAHYAWLSGAGLLVPPWLLTSDAQRLTAFAQQGRTVVKPVCGTRATTREVTASSFDGFERDQGPVLVQRLVEGDDVRVHVVGSRVVACRFSSDQVDYRSDRSSRRERIDIPDELAERLIAHTAAQGLAFAGWDFKVDGSQEYWCLESNPMPGYSFYDRVCEGAISDALIAELTSEEVRRATA